MVHTAVAGSVLTSVAVADLGGGGTWSCAPHGLKWLI